MRKLNGRVKIKQCVQFCLKRLRGFQALHLDHLSKKL